MERLYIALAKDKQTKDTIVFGVKADTPNQARSRIEKFYLDQGWEPPIDIQIVSFRSNSNEPVLFVGHAYWEYQKLEDEIKALSERLQAINIPVEE